MERYKQLLRIQRCILGEVDHEVTVRNIDGNYHCRVCMLTVNSTKKQSA